MNIDPTESRRCCVCAHRDCPDDRVNVAVDDFDIDGQTAWMCDRSDRCAERIAEAMADEPVEQPR